MSRRVNMRCVNRNKILQERWENVKCYATTSAAELAVDTTDR